MERIGIAHLAATQVGTLAHGQRQLVELATVIAPRPALILLDEPAAGLNPRESGDLSELLIHIRDEEKIGVLLIEHDMSVVMKISDHVVVLDYGRKISDGTPEFVKADPTVIRAYLGEEEDEELPDEVKRDLPEVAEREEGA